MAVPPSSLFRYTVVIGAYWVVAISMVFVTKKLMSGSHITSDIAILLVWTQNVISMGCIAIPSSMFKLLGMQWNGPKFETRKLIFADMIYASLTFTGTLVFNNLMLKYISVSFYQVARSLTLVFVILFSSLVLKEKVTTRVVLSCLFIISGFYISVDVEVFSHGVQTIGIVYGIIASLMAALCGVLFKRVQKNHQIGSMQLALNNSMISCAALTPLMMYTGQLFDFLATPASSHLSVWLLVVLSGVISLVMGWISAIQITVTSPLSHNISINAKSVFMTVLAVTWNGESRGFAWWMGNLFVMVGIGTYTYGRIKSIRTSSTRSGDSDMIIDQSTAAINNTNYHQYRMGGGSRNYSDDNKLHHFEDSSSPTSASFGDHHHDESLEIVRTSSFQLNQNQHRLLNGNGCVDGDTSGVNNC